MSDPKEIARGLSANQRATLLRALPDGKFGGMYGDAMPAVMHELGLCLPPDPSTNAIMLSSLGRAVAKELEPEPQRE